MRRTQSLCIDLVGFAGLSAAVVLPLFRPWVSRTSGRNGRTRKLLFALLPAAMIGCVTGPSFPPPPERPQPLSSFAVEFTPASAQRFPATDITEVKRFSTIAHWPGEPDWVSETEVPSRPYVVVGKLHFPIAWHYLETGVAWCPAQEGLIVYHVRAVGGQAVLHCEVLEQARGYMKDPDTGSSATISYRALTLDVIRFSD